MKTYQLQIVAFENMSYALKVIEKVLNLGWKISCTPYTARDSNHSILILNVFCDDDDTYSAIVSTLYREIPEYNTL